MQDKYVNLNPTIGFNRETWSTRYEYNVWDVGGCLVHGAEQNAEFFSANRDAGLKQLLTYVDFKGVIWVVDIS